MWLFLHLISVTMWLLVKFYVIIFLYFISEMF